MMADAHAQRLRELEQLSQAASGGVVLVGEDGTVRLRTEGAVQLLGSAGDVDLAWQRVQQRVVEALRDRPAGENEFALELPIAPDAEHGRLIVRVLRLGAPGGAGFLAILTDRRAIDALQADLRLAAQMRHLHATYRQAAHDLRAPLNAIALNLELIRQDLGVRSADAQLEAQDRLELIRREVTRLSRMLQVLLAQSGPLRARPRIFGLRRLLREVVELVGPQASRLGVRIALAVPVHRVAVLASRDDLKQALLNLLVNAFEAMPRGGPLEIRLDDAEGRAVVTIRDHGVGIAAQHLDRLFRLHFTTKPGGSGIGLFTTRAAVESMGGRLTIASTEHVGTTARIELPTADHEASQQEVPCSTS